jgi:phenylpropionate dioxygenase-like ring-hydroxylating dioxygenase large terminal subunit
VSDYPAAVARGWFPIAADRQLGRKPLSRLLMGRRLVVFRAAEGPAVLLDRCPHRNVALSAGRLRGGEIECPYHGWRFAGDGRCTRTPGAEQPSTHGAAGLPAVSHAGLVWTTIARDPDPFRPPPFPVGDAAFDGFWWPVEPSAAALVDAVENLLDPAHPHFLHPGLVRSDRARRPVQVTVRIGPDRAEAIYVENMRTDALIPRLLEGLRATSIGRFLPPATGQLVFEGRSGVRFALTVVFTPETPDRVRPFAHFATPKGPVPAILKAAALRALHMPVLAQDQAMLTAQTENVRAFGGPRYAQGPLDFLRPAIQALVQGETPEAREYQTEVLL